MHSRSHYNNFIMVPSCWHWFITLLAAERESGSREVYNSCMMEDFLIRAIGRIEQCRRHLKPKNHAASEWL